MLEYLFTSVFFLLPFILALIVIACTFFLIRSTTFGIICIFLGVLSEAFFLSSGSLYLGINVYVADLLPLALFSTGLLRWVFSCHEKWQLMAFRPAALWVCLLFVSLLRGLVEHGAAAGNDFRQFFYFISVATYLLSFPTTQISYISLERYWIRASVLMALLAVFRWSADALGVRIGPDWSTFIAGNKLRVLPADQALFIATGMLLLVSKSLKSGTGSFQKLMLALMGGSILLLQHRSVWVATLIGLMVVFVRSEEKDKKRLWIGLGWLSVAVLAAGIALSLGNLDKVSGDLQRSLQEIGEKRSTIAGRIDGWGVLVEGWLHSGVVDLSIGQPMGAGYERYLEVLGRSVKESPHNYYVQILLRSGFVGLFAFIAALAMIARRLARHSTGELTGQQTALLALVVMNAVYFIVYQVHFEQAMVFVLAMAHAENTAQSRIVRPIEA